jgi:hypothetical protein
MSFFECDWFPFIVFYYKITFVIIRKYRENANALGQGYLLIQIIAS